MTERQKKILSDAFTMLAVGARRGKRIVDGDATLAEIHQHIRDLGVLLDGMQEAIDYSIGAGALLAQVARAKTLDTYKR